MSGKSWLAIKDSFTYQSWILRPGYFSGFYCVESLKPLISFFLLHVDVFFWAPGLGRAGAACLFGPLLLLHKLFSLFKFLRVFASFYKTIWVKLLIEFLMKGRPLWSSFSTQVSLNRFQTF